MAAPAREEKLVKIVDGPTMTFTGPPHPTQKPSATLFPWAGEAQVAGAEVDTTRMTGITASILDLVGNTPLVRLNRLPQALGLECEVCAKLEFFNPGGAIKDRIGRQMVLDAQASGRLHAGDTLVEPTSGNTGIGMSLAAAACGYKMKVLMPQKMSKEKEVVMRALGADVIRTPTEAASSDPESHISQCWARVKADPEHVHCLDQYANPANPRAHYEGTAEEILRQTGGKVDMVVIGAGTGGTITGIAKKLKERVPGVIIVGVDPVGSLLAEGSYAPDFDPKPNMVEGIGYDFIPDVLDRSLVDEWIKTEDPESFDLARRLIAEEGLLIGGSSGSAMAGVAKAAKRLKKGQRCVVVFADGIRNYLTKFCDDDWMIEQGFKQGEQRKRTWDQQAKRIRELETENAELRSEKRLRTSPKLASLAAPQQEPRAA